MTCLTSSPGPWRLAPVWLGVGSLLVPVSPWTAFGVVGRWLLTLIRNTVELLVGMEYATRPGRLHCDYLIEHYGPESPSYQIGVVGRVIARGLLVGALGRS